MELSLRQMLDRVAQATHAGVDRVAHSHWHAVRVGRNRVWRITGGHPVKEVYFAKQWPNGADFRRELTGLQLATRLAEDNPAFMCAEVVFADENGGLILTRGLPGRSFAAILRDAFRLDKGILRCRQNAIAEARQCMSMGMEWLNVLHEQSVADRKDLRDHSMTAVCKRLLRVVDRCCGEPCGIAHSLLDSIYAFAIGLDTSDDGCNTLAFGDPSPGNFYLDGSRFGVIDFEDFGYGLRGWDEIHLDYWLAQADRHWLYWKCTELREKLDGCHIELERIILCRLLATLNRLRGMSAGPRDQGWLHRMHGRYERQAAIAELNQCVQSIPLDETRRRKTCGLKMMRVGVSGS